MKKKIKILEELKNRGDIQQVIDKSHTLKVLQGWNHLESFDLDIKDTALNAGLPVYRAKISPIPSTRRRLARYLKDLDINTITKYKYGNTEFALTLYETDTSKVIKYELIVEDGYVTVFDCSGFIYDLSDEHGQILGCI